MFVDGLKDPHTSQTLACLSIASLVNKKIIIGFKNATSKLQLIA